MLDTIKKVVGLAPPAEGVGADTPLTITEDGWFHGAGVTLVPSVRHWRLTTRAPSGEPAPLGVLWHWTGGVCRPGTAHNLAEWIRLRPGADEKPRSWHLCISKQGQVIQSVSLEVGAWHCERGLVRDPRGRHHRINRALIGIELENAGRLKLLHGAWRCHPYWKTDKSGKVVLINGLKVPDPKRIVDASRTIPVERHGIFDEFPEAQIVAARRVLEVLMDRYGLNPAHCRYQHGDFDNRKEDAGPLWRRALTTWFESLPPRDLATPQA